MLTDIPEFKGSSKTEQRGTWRRSLLLLADGYHWSATVWRPDCGRPMSLTNHKISSDGKVSPSVGHPDGYPPCPWHTHITLLGWESKTVPPLPPPPSEHACEKCGKVSREISGWGTWSGGTGIICTGCFKERSTQAWVPDEYLEDKIAAEIDRLQRQTESPK